MALSGLFGSPIESLKNLLANTAAFQTFTDTDTAIEAAARIHCVFEPADDAVWPLAVITYTEGQWTAGRDSMSRGEAAFGRSSSLTLIFEQEESTGITEESFINSISNIVSGMMSVSGLNNYMLIKNISLKGFYKDDLSENKAFSVIFTIEWGI